MPTVAPPPAEALAAITADLAALGTRRAQVRAIAYPIVTELAAVELLDFAVIAGARAELHLLDDLHRHLEQQRTLLQSQVQWAAEHTPPDALATYRERQARVDAAYLETGSITIAKEVADLMEATGLPQAQAIAQYNRRKEQL